jgi:hypothetical protein
MFGIASDDVNHVRKVLETEDPNEEDCPQSPLLFALTNKYLLNYWIMVRTQGGKILLDMVEYSADFYLDAALNLQMEFLQRRICFI